MSSDPGEQLLLLLSNPFSSTLQQTSIWTALGVSIGYTVFTTICFSFLRPYNQAVYAPRLKHADEKHAPPRLDKKPWSWIFPLWNTTEKQLIELVGMDAVIFLRFTRMCRNILLITSFIGCAILIPLNVRYSDAQEVSNEQPNLTWLLQVTPYAVRGKPYWGMVVVAYILNVVVMVFSWLNYRHIVDIRRAYMESSEYQGSLFARTLLLTDIPKEYCSDEGIARIIDSVAPHSSFARTSIGRNVKDLPELVAEHGQAVRKLEKLLATYLKNPNQLPSSRPRCRPSKKDPSYSTYPRGEKVDAIEYLTDRIRNLEVLIRDVRHSVDRRSTMTYGFASYEDVSEAHNIAYACRKKKPFGARVTLAPAPNDIIWDNMPLERAKRNWKAFLVTVWIALLTVLWIGPNAMMAVFLVNISNLGRVWEGFNTSLSKNPTFWGMFQGIANPALTSLIYLTLPIIFRRFSIMAGDRTKTGRERHVMSKLFSFFVFNNLIVFSLFSTAWSLISGIVQKTQGGMDAWNAFRSADPLGLIFRALCTSSPFWITWLLQRQFGAATDIAQLWPLIYGWCARHLSNPTPRELIELSAPPVFDYASYYNYFLFYLAVTLFFTPIQPLVVPAAALYFALDVHLKKYLLMYVFVTKTESGGLFWRPLFNRVIFAALLSNLAFFLSSLVRGYKLHAFCIVPLFVILILFKIYCSRTFDDLFYYYSTPDRPNGGHNVEAVPVSKEARPRHDKLSSRFGHPVLYQKLITPMVHQKAQFILPQVYKGRMDGDDSDNRASGYHSDMYAMENMQNNNTGKGRASQVPGFEYVSESHLDFEYYRSRPEFAAEHGAGNIFNLPSEYSRSGTPMSHISDSEQGSRTGSPSPALPLVTPGRPGWGPRETSYSPYTSRNASPGPTSTPPPQYPSPYQQHSNRLASNGTPNNYGQAFYGMAGGNTSRSRLVSSSGLPSPAMMHTNTATPSPPPASVVDQQTPQLPQLDLPPHLATMHGQMSPLANSYVSAAEAPELQETRQEGYDPLYHDSYRGTTQGNIGHRW